MRATRLTYNYRTNELSETSLTFSIIRVENFELLRWATVYEDEMEIVDAERKYGDLFEEDTEIKLLLKFKNGEEVVIEFNREIYDKLTEYFA